MEPQQARVTFAAFLVLSGIIVFNALYLQNDAGFARHAASEHVLLDHKTGDRSSFEATSRDVQGNDLVRAIRRELSQRSYFPGNSTSRLDGRIDAMTIGAIMAYQYDNGLRVTGLVSDELLKSFLFGVDKRAYRQGVIPEMSADTRQLVAEIQGILSAKGHYSGKIDGIFKNKTMEAVRRFESDKGLPVTGRISGLLVQELTRLTGVAFSASQN